MELYLIRFNPAESQLMIIGNSAVQWVSKVKYLGLYLTSGTHFKIDLTVSKRKYYGCFNIIKSTVGRQVNEIMLLHFIKTYCLPILLYGCEIWSLSSVSIRDLNVILNNCFRHVFNCRWRESVKPLQFYCNNLPLLDERVFFRKLFSSKNRILRALITLPTVHYEILGLVSKYGIYTLHYSIA